MKRQLLLAEFLSTPWALQPERLAAFAGIMHRWSAGGHASDDVLASIAADREARDARRAAAATPGTGGIAVLPLYGVVTQRGNMADDVSGPGSMSVQQFTGALRSALADPTVGQILIDIDSPGGSVYGVQELATEMMAARASKPIVAIANSLCASAAYWIGCCASELYVTPGGEVGSIGVWQAHQDCSEAMAEAGVKTTLISAGKYKTEGNPYAPLDADAQAFLQSRVDDYYQAFSKGVAKARGVGIDAVRNGMGQGRVLGADAALAEHMVDGIATFDEVVKKMQKSAKTAGRPAGVSRLAAMQRDLAILG
jgi:signal peptide peptidase SppA